LNENQIKIYKQKLTNSKEEVKLICETLKSDLRTDLVFWPTV